MNSKTAIKQLIKNYKATGSQKGAILETLTQGVSFTNTEARMAGIANPTSVVSKLRDDGYTIYSNPHNAKSGKSATGRRPHACNYGRTPAGIENRYRLSN
jgi:hypothetical protein